ncbi:cache domain-containing protein [Bradyrhizobium sp.]|uniref:cache domain-containing protein n=1 Tax=Bradyrhizobium sp. TaxID=376 RepID=UPI003C15CA7A
MQRVRFSIGLRIYSIIGLSFCGLIGLAAMQASNLADSLKQQRQNELSHLAQIALSIAREEYDASVRDHSSDDLARKTAAARISKLRYGDGDYFWINDLGPRMIMHPAKPELNGQDLTDNKDPNGKRLFVEFVNVVKKQGSGFVDYQWPKPGKDAPQPKLSYVTGFEPWGWIIGTGVYIDDLQVQLWDSARTVIVAALIVIGLLGTVTLIIARKISSALVAMTSSVTKLGEGDFGIELPGLNRGDELGDMARSIEQFKVKAAEKARNEAVLEEKQQQIAERNKGKALKEMADNVERETNAAVGEVAAGTERMANNAALMTDSALLLGENSSSVAAAAEEALANAQTVAKASSQLSASIAEIAFQVTSSRALMLEAVTASTEAQTTIAKLSEAAAKVGAVTNLISEIASQTNLLALNATIEAARAGDAGRGFAVVAAEVKSLAEQTAKATSEIAQQIAEIQGATQASVASIIGIAEVIQKVESVSLIVAAAIEKQNSVTVEISRTVEETSHAAREVAAQIVSVSNEAIETGRRASEIRDGSAEIAGKVNELRATLVRVIRTSTTDADRRISSRIDIRRPGTLKLEGRSGRVMVRDLSLGGAMIDETLPNTPVDTPMILVIDGISAELSGFVARKDETATLVKFKLSEQANRIVSEVVSTQRAA